jgi:type I restriction enzyme S subunit
VKDFHQNDRKFVYYFLTWFDLQRFESGTGVPTLNRNDVHSVSVVFPPLPEQQKIAAILTSVDDVIEKTQAQIDKLQDLKKGTMNQLLTRGIGHAEFKESPVGMIPVDWEVKQVSSVTSKVGSGVTPRGGSEVYQSEGVKFLRSQNVHFSGLRLDGVACIASEVHEGMSSSKVREGDVLLNITGASIGRCALVPKGIGEANVNQHVCIIRTTSVVDGAFVTYWLSSTCGQSQINKFQAGGNREGLNFQQIKAISISLPSISEQQKITSILTAIDTQIEAKQDKLKHTQALKKALMQDLLTGKKRVAA